MTTPKTDRQKAEDRLHRALKQLDNAWKNIVDTHSPYPDSPVKTELIAATKDINRASRHVSAVLYKQSLVTMRLKE